MCDTAVTSSLRHDERKEDAAQEKKAMIPHQPSSSPTDSPLQRLCQDLRKHFEQFGNGPEGADRVKSMMTQYINNNDDWREYAFFHPAYYARNLVEINDNFELIVRVPIHLALHYYFFRVDPSSSRACKMSSKLRKGAIN